MPLKWDAVFVVVGPPLMNKQFALSICSAASSGNPSQLAGSLLQDREIAVRSSENLQR